MSNFLHRLAGLVASASELERQLDVAHKELEAKHSALVGLEAEKRELVKGLALAEVCNDSEFWMITSMAFVLSEWFFFFHTPQIVK